MRTIETNRLLLRNICFEDSADLFEIFSDEQTCLDDGGYHAEKSIEDKSFKESMKYLVNANEHYAIVLREEHKVVGLVHIMESKREENAKELGYLVNKNYRRRGICKEAVLAVMNDLVENVNVSIFVMTAYEYNGASIATIESLAFKREGIILNDCVHSQKGLINSVQYCKEIYY